MPNVSYCVRCHKKTSDVNPRIVTTANGRTMKKSKCAICGGNKSEFMRSPTGNYGRKGKKGGDLKDVLGTIGGIASKIIPFFL